MKFVLYTIAVSPHQVPLFKAIAAIVGETECRYIAVRPPIRERVDMGWREVCDENWFIEESSNYGKAREILETAEVLLSGMRDWPLFEKRRALGLSTIYTGERWFKPPIGMLRLLQPMYFKMARRFVKLLKENEHIYAFPIGVHAARDMARLCGLMHGDLLCIFRAPTLDFERKPGGKICLKNGGPGKRYCLDKMRMWGYYVEPSSFDALPVQEASNPSVRQLTHSQLTTPNSIRVLWVGRLLNLKRVDTIVRAVGEHANLKRVDNSLPEITLDIYGTGPEESRLKKLAAKYGECIKFYPPVPIDEVRQLMREHDVYVLSSNAYEGWGAVVSEALEEGMKVIGTYEAGSSATVLPKDCLFNAGDWRQLMKIIASASAVLCPMGWNAKAAANAIINYMRRPTK